MKGDLFKIFEKEWIQIRKLQKYADMDGNKAIEITDALRIVDIVLGRE